MRLDARLRGGLSLRPCLCLIGDEFLALRLGGERLLLCDVAGQGLLLGLILRLRALPGDLGRKRLLARLGLSGRLLLRRGLSLHLRGHLTLAHRVGAGVRRRLGIGCGLLGGRWPNQSGGTVEGLRIGGRVDRQWA